MYKVLLIEDEEATRKHLAKYIEKELFEVIQAENGLIAMELFHMEHPQIVLTDLKMPGIGGMEVVRTIREISAETEIIVFTGHGDVDTAITALREGVLDYLKKPIDLNILTIALGRAKEKINMRKKEIFIPNILLVEDEGIPRTWLKYVLEKEDWKVLEASNGEAALTIFTLIKMDIVLLDIKMPKMNGLEALHLMRSINDDFEAIIISGHCDEHSAIQAMRDGAMSFLKKPVDLDQLILLVEKAIKKLQNDRELKYRTRELKLAQEIIAQITNEGEVPAINCKTIVEQAMILAQKSLSGSQVLNK
ncbi:MAG: response regulator [Nitrospirae bacterium YQR-1]